MSPPTGWRKESLNKKPGTPAVAGRAQRKQMGKKKEEKRRIRSKKEERGEKEKWKKSLEGTEKRIIETREKENDVEIK